jgi:hypothetical protein
MSSSHRIQEENYSLVYFNLYTPIYMEHGKVYGIQLTGSSYFANQLSHNFIINEIFKAYITSAQKIIYGKILCVISRTR